MITPPPSDNGAVVIPPTLPVASVKQNLYISSFNFPAESSDWKYVAGNSEICASYSSSSLTLQMLSYMGKANTGEIPNAYFCAYTYVYGGNSSVYSMGFDIRDYDNSSLLLYSITMEQRNSPYLEYTRYNTLSEMLYWIKKKPTESYSGYIYIPYDTSSIITIK